MVPQVDEENATVVAHAMDPAREARDASDIGIAQAAAGGGAVTV
jgi:hypothetical protein